MGGVKLSEIPLLRIQDYEKYKIQFLLIVVAEYQIGTGQNNCIAQTKAPSRCVIKKIPKLMFLNILNNFFCRRYTDFF